ncbi:MAG: hypothetical protein PHX60_00340 [Giesbergeria sp.]|uniref:hypothetical protein n=1 Tax=Giesbergeria sp. TaxID=2818473 RepID=UPI002617F99E|nr:hypothetical protein [Giesbergeria sp.]MDD2608130.1 hypothetical protein [Giesbergeria sp.]
MTPFQPIENANNADLRGSLLALQRAALRARQIAAQTGTAVVVVRNGVLEHIYPQAGHTDSAPQDAASVNGKAT